MPRATRRLCAAACEAPRLADRRVHTLAHCLAICFHVVVTVAVPMLCAWTVIRCAFLRVMVCTCGEERAARLGGDAAWGAGSLLGT